MSDSEKIPVSEERIINRFVGTVLTSQLDAALNYALSAFKALGYGPREASRRNVVEYAILRLLRDLESSPSFQEKYRAVYDGDFRLPEAFPYEADFRETFDSILPKE